MPRGSKRQVLLYITLSVRFVWFDLFAVSFNSLLDVPTQLSDCRQEPVEKMDRRISGVSYMYWMDFYNEIFCCVFLCARFNFSLFFRVSFPPTTPRATTPHRSLFRLPRRGLPRPYRCIQAIRLPCLQGYHTRAPTLQTNFWVQAGYHTCG